MASQSDLLRAVERSLRGGKPSAHAPVIDPLDLLPLPRLKTFARLSRSLHTVHEPAELLTEILDRAVEATQADRGLIVLSDAAAALQAKASRNMEEGLQSIDRPARRVMERALRGELAVSHPSGTRDIAIACMPLRLRQSVLGAAYLDRRARGPFAADDLAFLAAFAELAAVALDNVKRLEELGRENQALREEAGLKPRLQGMVGDSAAMRAIYGLVERVAASGCNVLIEGESGTGKELIARAIHQTSARRTGKFVPVHCGAIPENLIESELFGHRRGAFTGALADRSGLFEEASGGTLFLDEIHTTPPSVQVKLLRALQEREIRRVGDNVSRKVDVRLIAAANQELLGEVARGAFREDLYFRVAVVSITVPPLRSRKEDILPLADHALRRLAEVSGAKPKKLTHEAVEALLRHDWPGNVRELENALQKAMVLAEGSRIDVADLGLQRRATAAPQNLADALISLEREMVVQALERHGGNVSHAASTLGVLRQQLQRLLRRHKLEPREWKRRRYLRGDATGV